MNEKLLKPVGITVRGSLLKLIEEVAAMGESSMLVLL